MAGRAEAAAAPEGAGGLISADEDGRQYTNGFAEDDEEFVSGSDDDESADSPDTDSIDPADEAQVEAEEDVPGSEADAGDEDAGPSAEADRQASDAEDDAGSDDTPLEPWSFKADGKSVDVPGSYVFEAEGPDGTKQPFVVLPLAEVRRTLQPHLADRTAWREEKVSLLRQVESLKPELDLSVRKAEAITGLWEELLGMDDDAALKRLDEIRRDREAWTHEQEKAGLKAKVDALSAVGNEPDPQLLAVHQEQLVEGLQTTLRTELAALVDQPQSPFAVLKGEDLFDDLWDAHSEIFFEAEEDMQLADGTQVRAGEILVDRAALRERLGRRAKLVQNAIERAKKSARAADVNAQVLGQKPTAGVSTRRGQNAGGGNKKKTDAVSYEEWQEQFLGGSAETVD